MSITINSIRRKYEWPLNLICAVQTFSYRSVSGDFFQPTKLPEDILPSVEYALHILPNQKSAEVIKYRFRDGLTRKEIAIKLGVTENCINKLEMLGLRHLRHPMRNKFLKYGVSGVIRRASGTVIEDEKEIPICFLGLSTRIYNSLIRGGIYTVGDLTTMTYDDFLKIRNLGPKRIDEIIEALLNNGFCREV